MTSDDSRTLIQQEVTMASLPSIRTDSIAAAHAAGLDDDRASGFGLAVHEVAANAIEHGGGTGELIVIRDDGRMLAADVSDHGPGMLVPDSIEPPPADSVRGRGLWLSQTMTDRIHIDSDPSGTEVRLEMDL